MPGEGEASGLGVGLAVMMGDLDPPELHRPPPIERPRARTDEQGLQGDQEGDEPDREAEPVPHFQEGHARGSRWAFGQQKTRLASGLVKLDGGCARGRAIANKKPAEAGSF